MSKPLLSIIINTWGKGSDLPIILGQLEHQRVNVRVPHSRKPKTLCSWGLGKKCEVDYETIVVSNGPYSGNLRRGYHFTKLLIVPRREDTFGHHVRDPALVFADGEWIVMTNSDNYFMLGWLDLIGKHLRKKQNGVVYWDGINNYWRWGSLGGSKLMRGKIDLSFVAVRSEIAKSVGFPYRNFDGDWDYINACVKLSEKLKLQVQHIPHVLGVHN